MTLLSPKNHIAHSRLEYKKWASNLRTAKDGNISAQVGSVTYNLKKETIVLRGYSKEAIERAKEVLQTLLLTCSEHWVSNELKNLPPNLHHEASGSRSGILSSSREQCSCISEPDKIFPIKPKDHRRLVGVWFRHILPALPKILSSRVGETYTASLVRRGQTDFRAEPCIEIETPDVPGPKARRIIEDLLNDICGKGNLGNHDPIPVHFSQGNVRDLIGRGEKDDDNNAQEDEDGQRYQFNMARPYSKHRMGASLGLLCSNKVVGTLGGYVYVDGEKHMLTSEHFIARSQELENRDPKDRHRDDQDLETLISPSRFHLGWLEMSLKQKLRDLHSEFSQQYPNTYGDRNIPLDLIQPPEIAETRKAMSRTQTLLGQVAQPPSEFAIGHVFRRSVEPRKAAIPKSLEDIARLDDAQQWGNYHMDWALCKANAQASGTGENRHKYRSDSDARADDYTEEHESELKYLPGDLCQQTCPVESGTEVYYVGQGSRYRSGSVNIPTLVSRDGVQTLDWAIISSDGQRLPYSHVEGDSGAWVIKRNGNMLMGQVHSYTSGQILFTPIDAIFDDISRDCGVAVCLPPQSLDAGPTIEALPLCAIPSTPPILALDFIKPQKIKSATAAQKSPLETPVIKTQNSEPSSSIADQMDAVNECSEVLSDTSCDSLSSLPSPMDTSQSWGLDSDLSESTQSSNEAELPDAQRDLKRPQSRSLPNFAMPETPDFTFNEQQGVQRLDLAPYKDQVRNRSHVPINLSMRKVSWPAVKEGKGRRSRPQLSRLAAPLVSAFVCLNRFACSIGIKLPITQTVLWAYQLITVYRRYWPL